MELIQAPQYLKVQTLMLRFPSDDMTVEEVVELYKVNYPVLMNASINDPVLESGNLVWEAVPPPVKTKGRKKKPLTILRQLAKGQTVPEWNTHKPMRIVITGARVGSVLNVLQRPRPLRASLPVSMPLPPP